MSNKNDHKHKSYKRQVTFWRANAALISVIFHLILFISAGSIIAIKWMEKPEAEFTGKQAERPALPRRRLQLPVNVQKLQKKTRRPQVTTRMSTKGPADLALPDVDIPDDMDEMGFDRNLAVGSGRGLGNMGNAGSLGFGISDVNFFGLKSRGEKIMFLVDSGVSMLKDKKGGVGAFQVVKDELKKRVGMMSAATLFNVIAFDLHKKTDMFAHKMLPAKKENKNKLADWLEPLNKSVANLGPQRNNYAPRKSYGPVSADDTREWLRAIWAAMPQKPDTIFILAGRWGHFISEGGFPSKAAELRWLEKRGWDEERLAKYDRQQKVAIAKAKKLLKFENQRRAQQGLPNKVFNNWRHLMKEFNIERPEKPPNNRQFYSAEDILEGLLQATREIYVAHNLEPPSINIVYLTGEDEEIGEKPESKFKKVVKTFNGRMRTLEGLQAIEMMVQAEMLEDLEKTD